MSNNLAKKGKVTVPTTTGTGKRSPHGEQSKLPREPGNEHADFDSESSDEEPQPPKPRGRRNVMVEESEDNGDDELDGGDGENANTSDTEKHGAQSGADGDEEVPSHEDEITDENPVKPSKSKKTMSEARKNAEEQADERKAKAKSSMADGKLGMTEPSESEDDANTQGAANNHPQKRQPGRSKGKDKERKKDVPIEDEDTQESVMEVDELDDVAAAPAKSKKKLTKAEEADDNKSHPRKSKRKPKTEVEEVTDDEAPPPRRTRTTKPKANTKVSTAAKKKPPQRVKVMTADKNTNDMEAAERQARIQDNLREALLGVSKLNIGMPKGKVKLNWGDINNRPLNQRHIAGLARSIRDGKHADRYPVYATIPRTWIDVDSLSPKGEAYLKLKEPEYTADGLGKNVNILSGHHRQKALESLLAEYKMNLEKSKTELVNVQKEIKKGKGVNDELAHQCELMQEQVNRLTAMYNEAGMWEVEWYDEDILTDESRAHLSENADFPTMPADEQEKAHMLMWLVKSVSVQWARKKGEKELPTPDSEAWEEEILKHAVTATHLKNGHINFLIKHRVQYELYSMALEYPYFRDFTNLSLDQLSDAMQTPSNKTLKDVRTLGTFWAWMIRQGLTQMNMVANSRTFPDVNDNEDEKSLPMHNLLTVLSGKDEDLRIGDRAWDCVIEEKTERKKATTMQKERVRTHQKEFAYSEYKTFEKGMTAVDANFIPDVFSKMVLHEIDSAYDRVFGSWDEAEKDSHFLDSSSKIFKEKMYAYNCDVQTILKRMWRERCQAAEGTLSDREMKAFTNAEQKLSWIMQLRAHGHYANIPFPTKTFIKDSLARLKTPSNGFQMLCRLVDPLCDSIIRRTTDVGTGDIWDYVGYMLYYLGQDNSLKLFKHDSDLEHSLCTWILGNMQLLDQTSASFLRSVNGTVKTFISYTNANWIDAIKSKNMAKTSKPDEDPTPRATGKGRGNLNAHAPPGSVELCLPPLLLNDFPDFKWTEEMAKSAARMARVIADLMEGSGSSQKAQGGGKRGVRTDGVPIRRGPSPANLNDAVARALPEVWLEDACVHKPLYMLYRHAFDWRNLDLRSISDKSWSYAYRLSFAWHCHKLTWGRMITHAPCQKLRAEFFKFLSAHALPSAMTSPATSRSDTALVSPTEVWANWDDALIDEIKEAAKKHGLVEDPNQAQTPLSLLKSAKRWEKYENEIKKIINTVRDCLCAQAGDFADLPDKVSQGRIYPSVAASLENLLMSLARNADRLEHRILTRSAGDPWVSPARVGLRDSFFPALPEGDEDPNAFSDLHDFSLRDEDRFNRFVEGVKSHGYPVGDISEFVNMERERPLRQDDEPSRLLNTHRLGPVLPQDVNWREKWAKKPVRKNKRLRRKAATTPDAVAQGDRVLPPDPPLDVDVTPSPRNKSKALSRGPQPSVSALFPVQESSEQARFAGRPATPDRAGRSAVTGSGTKMTLEVDDGELSTPPLNQAALKHKHVAKSTEESVELRLTDDGLADRSLASSFTSPPVSESASWDLIRTSSESSELRHSGERNRKGRDGSDDPFAEDFAMDIDHSDDGELNPTGLQLVDEHSWLHIEGNAWRQHCLEAIENFQSAPGSIQNSSTTRKMWKTIWVVARDKHKEDPVPPVVIDYILALDGEPMAVEALKQQLLDNNGAQKLLTRNECRRDVGPSGGHRVPPTQQLRHSSRHLEKRPRQEAGPSSPQSSPSPKRKSKRAKHQYALEGEPAESDAKGGGPGDTIADDTEDEDDGNIYATGPGHALPPPRGAC
ncbi:hypothetical protein LXA43DRAFT_1102095 [Ganoderma leucocontextum]|nr:hypothetical protein LXA43DRAFT_1102095 [Ganoderma leucocontextum]